MSASRLLTSLCLLFLALGCAEDASSPTRVEGSPHLLRWGRSQPQFVFEGAVEPRVPFLSLNGQPVPPAVDGSSSATASTASLGWSHTVGTGVDRLLVVAISIRNAGKQVTAVTYRGQALTRLGTRNNHDDAVRVELWYQLAPASGAGTVAVTLSGSAKVVAGAASFTGVHQVTPFDVLVSAGSTDTGTNDPVVADSSGAGELVVSAVATEGSAGTSLAPRAGQSMAWNRYYGTSGGDVAGGGSTATGAAQLVMGWTKTKNAKWAILAVALKPAPSIALTAYKAQFWAVRGEPRTLQIDYAGGGGSAPFLQLTTTDPTFTPGRGTLAVGDSVLVTVSLDPTAMVVRFEPSGTRFGTPSQLTIWYGGAGGDLNGDGLVNGNDAYIEANLLGMWYQGSDSDPWSSISATKSLTQQSLTSALQHFSNYAVAYRR